MAENWIKMRNNLPKDLTVIQMAAQLGIEIDLVVGKLHRVWSFADEATADGWLPKLTVAWLDDFLNCPGFAAAMAAGGWLSIHDDGLTIPSYDTHNGKSAKRRAQTTRRVANLRECNAASVTSVTLPALPEQSRAEQISGEEIQPAGRQACQLEIPFDQRQQILADYKAAKHTIDDPNDREKPPRLVRNHDERDLLCQLVIFCAYHSEADEALMATALDRLKEKLRTGGKLDKPPVRYLKGTIKKIWLERRPGKLDGDWWNLFRKCGVPPDLFSRAPPASLCG